MSGPGADVWRIPAHERRNASRAMAKNLGSFAASRAPCQRRASRSSAVASVSSFFAKQKRTTPDSCGS